MDWVEEAQPVVARVALWGLSDTSSCSTLGWKVIVAVEGEEDAGVVVPTADG